MTIRPRLICPHAILSPAVLSSHISSLFICPRRNFVPGSNPAFLVLTCPHSSPPAMGEGVSSKKLAILPAARAALAFNNGTRSQKLSLETSSVTNNFQNSKL